MANYLSQVRIDCHDEGIGWKCQITDTQTGKQLTNVSKIEVSIEPDRLITAKLTFVEIAPTETGLHALQHVEIISDVSLLPLLAMVTQAHTDHWTLDADHWHYSDPDHLIVQFERKREE